MNTGDFDSTRLSHAYIASAEPAQTIALAAVCDSDGKRPCRVCTHCNKALRGIHPDIMVIEPRTQEIVVDQIRALHSDVYTVPNEAMKKAYIIQNAERMNTAAQNALLRILEEPPKHAVFILSTESPLTLLPTVRSRCVLLRSAPEHSETNESATGLVDDFFDALERGSVELMAFMFRLEKQGKDDLPEFIEGARAEVAMRLRSPDKISPELLSELERVLRQAGEYLDFNVGVGHISGIICASLLKP